MIQFLIFLRGKGWGCARLEQKVLTEKLFLSELFNNLFYISLNENFVYVAVFFALKDMFRLEKIEKKKEYTAEHIFKPM